MNRRQFFSRSFSAILVSLAGCSQRDAGEKADTDTASSADAENEGGSETPSAEGSEPGCWPAMCAGTQLIEVAANAEFSGTAVFEASCRDDSLSIQAGETAELVRTEDAEECGVTLFIDDEQVYSERVEGNASITLTVGRNGDIEEAVVML